MCLVADRHGQRYLRIRVVWTWTLKPLNQNPLNSLLVLVFVLQIQLTEFKLKLQIMDSVTLPLSLPALPSSTHRPPWNPRAAAAFRCFHGSAPLPRLRGSPLLAANTLTASSVPVCYVSSYSPPVTFLCELCTPYSMWISCTGLVIVDNYLGNKGLRVCYTVRIRIILIYITD